MPSCDRFLPALTESLPFGSAHPHPIGHDDHSLLFRAAGGLCRWCGCGGFHKSGDEETHVEESRPRCSSLFLFASISLAQTSRSEVSASFTGNFSKESDGNSIAQTASNSGGFLASYRFSFGSFSAVELNYGYTRNDQNYNFGIPIISSSTIQTDVHEATAAYVLTPRGSGRLKPFVLGGAGR